MQRNHILVAVLLAGAATARGQTVTAEFDPDVYFDRGVTLAVGVKPSPDSRWTILGDFASRKVGRAERLSWRVGGGVRLRLLGQRNNVFSQLNLSADRFRSATRTEVGASLRPGIGAQWFPWKDRGFYVLPLLAVENYPGPKTPGLRGEFRIGWQR